MELHTLVWSQPRALRRQYQLRRGRDLVGELRFPGLFTARATATVEHQLWDIRAEGFYQSAVHVARAGATDAELTFTRDPIRSGGLLDFRGHPPLRIRIGTLRRRVLVRTPDREAVMRIGYRGLLRMRGEVRFGPRQTSHDFRLLAVIGWYLVVTGVFQLGVEYGIP